MKSSKSFSAAVLPDQFQTCKPGKMVYNHQNILKASLAGLQVKVVNSCRGELVKMLPMSSHIKFVNFFFFLLNTGTLSRHLSRKILFHVWPIKSLSSQTQDSFGPHMTLVIVSEPQASTGQARRIEISQFSCIADHPGVEVSPTYADVSLPAHQLPFSYQWSECRKSLLV